MSRPIGADEVKRTIWAVPPGNWTTDAAIVSYFLRRYRQSGGHPLTLDELGDLRVLLQLVLAEGAVGSKVSVMGNVRDLEVHRVVDEHWIRGEENAREPDLEALRLEGVHFSRRSGFWARGWQASVPLFDYAHFAPL